jgi:hypothetical protein
LVITGVMSTISIMLGVTTWGFILWFEEISLTIMHVPVITGAALVLLTALFLAKRFGQRRENKEGGNQYEQVVYSNDPVTDSDAGWLYARGTGA